MFVINFSVYFVLDWLEFLFNKLILLAYVWCIVRSVIVKWIGPWSFDLVITDCWWCVHQLVQNFDTWGILWMTVMIGTSCALAHERTSNSILITLAIFLETATLLTWTSLFTFLYFLNTCLSRKKSFRISFQYFVNDFLSFEVIFFCIFAAFTRTRPAVHPRSKTFTIKFEALRVLAITVLTTRIRPLEIKAIFFI